MLEMATASKANTLTFRINPELKTALKRIAEAEAKPVGELLRQWVRDRIEQRHRQQFEAEARRQSREATAAAHDPNSDEAQVIREIESDFEAWANEWK